MNLNFMLWIPVASNVGPRGFSNEYITKGHDGMYDQHHHERIVTSGAGVVAWWLPGGEEEDGSQAFDGMSNCRRSPWSQVRHLGEPEPLVYAMLEAKKLGRKTALYLGPTIPFNDLSTQSITYRVHTELDPFVDACDIVIIDGAAAAVEGDAYCVAHRIITRDLNMECWAEARAVAGGYSGINGHTHLCPGETWDRHNGAAGSAECPRDNGKTWVLSQTSDPTGANARRYKTECGRVAVGESERHITAASLSSVVKEGAD